MTAPDFIWAWKEDQGDVWTGEWAPVGDKNAPYEAQEFVRRDPAVLAELPEVKTLVAVAVEGAAIVARDRYMVWGREGDDCEVNCDFTACQDIAAAIRALTPADHKAALDRMLQEREQRGRNGALREAADEWLNVRAEGRLVMAALIAYSDRIRALIQEAQHDPA
jgi:hypothetical protein